MLPNISMKQMVDKYQEGKLKVLRGGNKKL
jgi:hypothetical protein